MSKEPSERFIRSVELPVSRDRAFQWHARPGALERLTPGWEPVRVVERSGGIRDGGKVVLHMGLGPVSLLWEARHQGYDPPRQFEDELVKGPFSTWVHTHRFAERGSSHCVLTDDLRFRLPVAALSGWAANRWVHHKLDRLFRYRHRVTMDDLQRHAQFEGQPRKVVAISGASGLIGSALSRFLTLGGHRVLRLVRRSSRGDDEVQWDPAKGEVELDKLQQAEVIVHLAAENIASGPWTAKRKERILRSRVDGTRCLAKAVAELHADAPKTLIAASAIGLYGDAGEELVDESSPSGEGFLADVVGQWERAADPARESGARVVHSRFGVVLSPEGGMLRTLLPAFRAFLGGRVGSGKQWMSWVAIDDAVGAVHHAIMDEQLVGPVNVVSPHAVRNREFTRTVARVVGRPAILPLPKPVVANLLGEMGRELLLSGAQVRPAKLSQAGFRWEYPELEDALRHQVGKAE